MPSSHHWIAAEIWHLQSCREPLWSPRGIVPTWSMFACRFLLFSTALDNPKRYHGISRMGIITTHIWWCKTLIHCPNFASNEKTIYHKREHNRFSVFLGWKMSTCKLIKFLEWINKAPYYKKIYAPRQEHCGYIPRNMITHCLTGEWMHRQSSCFIKTNTFIQR